MKKGLSRHLLRHFMLIILRRTTIHSWQFYLKLQTNQERSEGPSRHALSPRMTAIMRIVFSLPLKMMAHSFQGTVTLFWTMINIHFFALNLKQSNKSEKKIDNVKRIAKNTSATVRSAGPVEDIDPSFTGNDSPYWIHKGFQSKFK